MPDTASCSINHSHSPAASPPRLGFVGVGWIGVNRLEAIADSQLAEIVAVADSNDHAATQVARRFGANKRTFQELLDSDVDAVVIATPSALHADQAIAALDAGKAVFCQKPLGRNAAETAAVVAAACRANRLLGVDFSYRHTAAMRAIRKLILSGELGEIFAVEAVFHNAYGPDKPWFYQRSESGGGCLLDLGIHLVDLALWALDFPVVSSARGLLRHQGQKLTASGQDVEDYASGLIELENGPSIQIACSWRAPAGCDAQIGLRFFGTRGGAEMSNLAGSFYDFRAEHLRCDRSRHTLFTGPDNWGGRAALAWLRQLAVTRNFRTEISQVNAVANTLDLLSGCYR
jgi:predicted dehydrogenase